MKKFSSPLWTDTKEIAQAVVDSALTFRDVLDHYGYNYNSQSYVTVKKRLDALGVDRSSLINPNIEDGRKRVRYSAETLLVKGRKVQNHTIKKFILRNNLLPYECQICGNDGTWQGQPIVLHLDHINGDNDDCRLDNLRFLFPNCHSQTDTYCRNKSER